MQRRAKTIVVPHADLVGRTVTLHVARLGAAGAFLAAAAAPASAAGAARAPETSPDDAAPAPAGEQRRPGAPDATILLPKREVPAGTTVGDAVTVFVGLDSDDRPIATTRVPTIQLGEVAFLRVTAVTPVGAFVDWGLPKELMVPFREQTRDLRVGDRHPVGLFVDKTGRLAGTMRVSEFLRDVPVVRVGEWVAGESWRVDPAVGLFVIVERRFVGLVPKSEPHGLARGDAAMFRVTRVRPDGRFELSLRAIAHEEMAEDAGHVLAILRAPGTPRVGDHTSPDEIRARFGLSKKAFKRAVGRLLKERSVVIEADGSVSAAGAAPGPAPRPAGSAPRPAGSASSSPGPAPRSHGSAQRSGPRSHGSAQRSGPRSRGSAPQTHGSAPRSAGSAPQSRGFAPKPYGSAPQSPGSGPRSAGSAPQSRGFAPKSYGSAPQTHGPGPRSAASAPHSRGFAPKSYGSAPRSPGSAPRPHGSAPTSHERAPARQPRHAPGPRPQTAGAEARTPAAPTDPRNRSRTPRPGAPRERPRDRRR